MCRWLAVGKAPAAGSTSRAPRPANATADQPQASASASSQSAGNGPPQPQQQAASSGMADPSRWLSTEGYNTLKWQVRSLLCDVLPLSCQCMPFHRWGHIELSPMCASMFRFNCAAHVGARPEVCALCSGTALVTPVLCFLFHRSSAATLLASSVRHIPRSCSEASGDCWEVSQAIVGPASAGKDEQVQRQQLHVGEGKAGA